METHYKWVIGIAIVFTIIAIIFFPGKNCQNDEQCINDRAKECARATAQITVDGNLQQYTIKSDKKDTCLLEIEMITVGDDAEQKIKDLLENKAMVCEIPKQILQEVSLTDIDHISDYCTGQLKEALQEILIEKLYSVIIANLGQISLSLQNATASQTM